MSSLRLSGLFAVFMATAAFAGDKAASDSLHKVRMVEVEKGITLEVLDWGGRGRPIIFLAGLGDTAHVFDQLAPKLAGTGHLYGITRRGFGASTHPVPPTFDVTALDDGSFEFARHDPSEANPYDADRLGDDVLAVIEKLKLARPVLIGHSVAGEELSSVGSRHPEKVAGLVYLDALLPSYAFFNGPDEEFPFRASGAHPRVAGPRPPSETMLAVITGAQKYSKLPVPVLGLVSFPRRPPPGADSDAVIADRYAAATAKDEERIESLRRDVPTARIVPLRYADHYVWDSNESEVLKEIRAFLSRLP